MKIDARLLLDARSADPERRGAAVDALLALGPEGVPIVVESLRSAGPNRWLVAEHDPIAVDTAQWNEYTVIARGNHLIHKLNGQVTIDLIDHEEKARAFEGLLAFQIHRGPAMRSQA